MAFIDRFFLLFPLSFECGMVLLFLLALCVQPQLHKCRKVENSPCTPSAQPAHALMLHLYRSIQLNNITAVLHMYNGCICYRCACIMIKIHSTIVNACGAGIITYQVGFITMCIDFSSFSYRNYYIND